MMRCSDRGYTLPEMLMVGFVSVVLVDIFATQLTSTVRLHRLTTLSLDRNAAIRVVEDRFRDAVRNASDVIERIGPFETDSDTLVLSRAGGSSAIVLGVVGDEPRFTVLYVDNAAGGVELTRRVSIPLRCNPVFLVERDALYHPRLVVLQLQIHTNGTGRTVVGSNTMMAALGGGVS